MGYAIRSLNEVETQFEAARRAGLVHDDEAKRLGEMIDESLRLTYGLKRSL